MSAKRILIVDDDREFAQAVAMRCRGMGLEVETAANALTAITVVGVRRPDLIFLDVNMPTANGLNVTKFLADDPATARIPVIIVTGSDSTATIRRCAELKAEYIHKSPDMWQSLRSRILTLLQLAPENEAPATESAAAMT